MNQKNEQQYKLVLERNLVPESRLRLLYSQGYWKSSQDFCEFLVQQGMIGVGEANSIRQAASLFCAQSAQEIESGYQSERRAEQQFLALIDQHPLFSPHARIQFKLVEKLGEGGMGVVHRVEDKKLGRYAALKVLASVGNERAVTRFIREARITASLVHPNIPPIYELGMNSSGEHYMLMKVIEGQSLRQAIQEVHSEGKADPKEIRRLLEALIKVCEAMAYAHSKNVIHRDLKPENIMIGEFGEVMVLDWGLARDLSEDEDDLELENQQSLGLRAAAQKEGLTGEGDLLGTVGYMAPEQVEGQACKQSDIFALGAILTEVLTGKRAIEGEGTITKLTATIQGRIFGPKQLLRSSPSDLNSLALKGMAFKRRERFRKVEDFLSELKSYLAGEDLRCHSYSVASRCLRWMGRHPTLLSSGVLLLVLMGSLVFVRLSLTNAETRERETKAEESIQKGLTQRFEESLDYFERAEAASRSESKKEEVIDLVEAGLKLSGRRESQMLRAAEIYRQAGFFRESLELLKDVERDYQPAYEALYLQHLILSRDNANQFTLTAPFNRLVSLAKERGESNEFTHMVSVFEAYKRKDWNGAIEACNQMEKYTKKRFELFMVRATARSLLGQFEKALLDYDTAIGLNPKHSPAFYSRGGVYFQLGKIDEAEDNWASAIYLSENVLALLTMGERRLSMGKPRLALYYVEKGLQMAPNQATLLRLKGRALHALKRYQESVMVFNKAIKSAKKPLEILLDRAVVFLAMERYEAGINDFSTVLKSEPKNIAALRGLGECYYAMGKYRYSISYYDQVCQLQPESGDLRLRRGFTMAALGLNQEALLDMDRALRLDPKITDIYLYRGNLKLRMKSYRAAALDYEQYLRVNPNTAERSHLREVIQKHLGRSSRY